MEPLSFKEQIKVYASSQVLLMTHGAALVNIMFMPEVTIKHSVSLFGLVHAYVDVKHRTYCTVSWASFLGLA